MSGIVPCLIFLFLAPFIFIALIKLDSAKERKLEQDNSCICDNTEVRATELSMNSDNREPCTLTPNITLTENNKASKRVDKKQKDYTLVNDVYYKAYNEAESMMTDYNAAKEITNDSADLATFEDGYHFDNYAEDFKQENDKDSENY